jgi:hypothetical protein
VKMGGYFRGVKGNFPKKKMGLLREKESSREEKRKLEKKRGSMRTGGERWKREAE